MSLDVNDKEQSGLQVGESTFWLEAKIQGTVPKD
jgi:hypothetical protein